MVSALEGFHCAGYQAKSHTSRPATSHQVSNTHRHKISTHWLLYSYKLPSYNMVASKLPLLTWLLWAMLHRWDMLIQQLPTLYKHSLILASICERKRLYLGMFKYTHVHSFTSRSLYTQSYTLYCTVYSYVLVNAYTQCTLMYRYIHYSTCI